MEENEQPKVERYEQFLNETLREDLKKVERKREDVCLQLLEISQLRDTFKLWSIDDSSKTVRKAQTDLGCNFYAKCVIPSTDRILIFVGLGFYLEMTIKEATEFLHKKEAILNEEANSLSKEAHKVKAHIAVVMKALFDLQNLPEKIESNESVFDI
ncbi:protein UXT-like protein [Leptotrombidium deliense]|uniref:Protein UXT-like protein n=1 Tax=Leptotrombidium deliense TaxID=299467 RepID=A0A443SNC4_9ACAR|nr:protein UXT-like protein [Leptotrombidium deliense]